MSVDELAHAIWRDALPNNTRAALHTLISRLRSMIRNFDGWSIDTQSSEYALDAPRRSIDAFAFEDMIASSKRLADPRAADVVLADALAFWRGRAFGHFATEEFAMAEAGRLEALKDVALEERSYRLCQLGDYVGALGFLRTAIDRQPLREGLRQQLMRTLHQAGRPNEALAEYAEFRMVLAEELGVEPSPAMQELHIRILRDDPSLTQQHVRANEFLDTEPEPMRLTFPSTPKRRDKFFGRERELETIGKLLQDHRLLSLVGAGGVGKTRLALQAASTVVEAPDGVIFCDLAGVTTMRDALGVLSTAAGALPDARQELQEQVFALLGSGAYLVILDNCEHLLGDQELPAFVDRLLDSTEQVNVLTTTRTRLGVISEQVFPILPLPLPLPTTTESSATSPAIELFLDRARAGDRSADFLATMHADIVQLCRELDGLPLAIELAASRVRAISLSDLLDRWRSEPGLVKANFAGSAERHRSLDRIVEWSYRLLSPPEQDVFDQISVLPGEFGLDAVINIVEVGISDADKVETIVNLCERSLIQRVQHGAASRYKMLETIRAFGKRRLHERRLYDSLEQRCADYYTKFVVDILRQQPAQWIREIDAEISNLRHVRSWTKANDTDTLIHLTSALYPYAAASLNAEVFDWCEDAIRITSVETEGVGGVYAVAAMGRWLGGDVPGSQDLVETALHFSASASDIAALALTMGDIYKLRGEFSESAAWYARAREKAREAGNAYLEICARMLQGCTSTRAGMTAEAQSLIDSARADARQAGWTDLMAACHMVMAEVHTVEDPNPSQALHWYWESVELAEAANHMLMIHETMVAAALAEMTFGSLEKSISAYVKLLGRWQGLRNDVPLECALRAVITLLVELGLYEEAAILSGFAPRDRSLAAFVVEPFVEKVNVSVQTCRGALGDVLFQSAECRGRSMTTVAVVDYTLSKLTGVSLGEVADSK
ncbi:BTAD domain-containing putative transcriptional regulator [Catellatospora sp. NPDC049609]|uniref:ATP-binding protein n=1 Tax=Catellatospora sp. NPDC049609 TaxID=3155505 RepID=UPI0034220DCC